MATVYVSYRNRERPLVEAVTKRLEDDHDVRIDYKIPAGTNWRSYQDDELKRSDVFLVFVSNDTADSEFQNAEIGAARFCSTVLDGKLILPALIDDGGPPRILKDIDYLDLRHRDVSRAAQQISQTLARRAQRVRLFISHSHRDEDLASRLVDVAHREPRDPAW